MCPVGFTPTRLCDGRLVQSAAMASAARPNPSPVLEASWFHAHWPKLLTVLVTVHYLVSRGMPCFVNSRKGSHGWLAMSFVCYCGAMLTKEPGIMLPAVAFLYVLLFEAEGERAASLRRAFFTISWYVPFAVAYLAVRHAVLDFIDSCWLQEWISQIYPPLLYTDFGGGGTPLLEKNAEGERITVIARGR